MECIHYNNDTPQRSVRHNGFLHHEHVITAKSPRMWHRGSELSPKPNVTELMNSGGAFSMKPLLYPAYSNILIERGGESWLWTSDCSLMMLFLKCRFMLLPERITTSEKCLTNFFHIRKPNTSNSCICPVVPFGIISNTIFLFGGVTTLTTSGQCPLQESIKSAL